MIKNWTQFNEGLHNNMNQDIEKILNWVGQNIPSSEIPLLKKDIYSILNESVNESIISEVKNRLIKWFDAKIMNYFINKKADFYTELIGKLNLFDLTTLDDIKSNFRNFHLESIYLCGGMDKAKDVGAGWRGEVEYEFEVNNPGIQSDIANTISIIYHGRNVEVDPAYVIDSEHLEEFIKKGKTYLRKYYDLPAIINPVRKEMDRTKNANFAKEIGRFKSGEYEKTMDTRSFDVVNKTFSSIIEPDDEILVNLCDAFFVGFNDVTSGGSFAELQMMSFLKKPIFAWYIDGWKISGHSPWNLPHICKMMRSYDDMKTFVKTMIDFEK